MRDQASAPAPTEGADFPVAAGVLSGLGLGGFFDGIVLHQGLQWHHMLSSRYPITSIENLELNTLWDGIFHSVTYVFVVVGLFILWRRARGGGICAGRTGRWPAAFSSAGGCSTSSKVWSTTSGSACATSTSRWTGHTGRPGISASSPGASPFCWAASGCCGRGAGRPGQLPRRAVAMRRAGEGGLRRETNARRRAWPRLVFAAGLGLATMPAWRVPAFGIRVSAEDLLQIRGLPW